MNDENAGQSQAVALFSAIPWSIPIPKTSYLLIAAVRRGFAKGRPEQNSAVKNHIFFTETVYSLRVIIILCAS